MKPTPRQRATGGRNGGFRPGDVFITKPQGHGVAGERFMVHPAFTRGDTGWGGHLTDAGYPPAEGA